MRVERSAAPRHAAVIENTSPARDRSCTNYYNCRGHDGCCNTHTTQGVIQAVDDDNAEIDDAGEEIVDGEEDVVVVTDGEHEHADSNNLDDEWE